MAVLWECDRGKPPTAGAVYMSRQVTCTCNSTVIFPRSLTRPFSGSSKSATRQGQGAGTPSEGQLQAQLSEAGGQAGNDLQAACKVGFACVQLSSAMQCACRANTSWCLTCHCCERGVGPLALPAAQLIVAKVQGMLCGSRAASPQCALQALADWA